MTVIQIDVVADFICAVSLIDDDATMRARLIHMLSQWCFIGKRQLEQAISLYKKTYPGGKHDDFQVTWRPYYLNYNDSAQSVDKLDLAERKLAGMTSTQRGALQQRMERLGRSVGINFKWGGKVGRTQDAHRLVYAARLKSLQTQNDIVEALFQAYQENELDISCRVELSSLATAAGLEEAEVDECLSSVEVGENVDAEARKYRSRVDRRGVPAFIVQDSYFLSGAQDVQDFMEVFIKVKESAQ